MFAFLEGRLDQVGTDHVVLDVGGVGYRLAVSGRTLLSLPPAGRPLRLRTRMVLREDDVSLYGFLTDEEEQAFGLLVSVSGVGPKVALAVLTGMDPHHFRSVVFSEDARRLQAIPGIGKKLAERIVLELKDRVEEPVVVTARVPGDALDALLSLGIRDAEARSALMGLDGDLEDVVRTALRRIGEAK